MLLKTHLILLIFMLIYCSTENEEYSGKEMDAIIGGRNVTEEEWKNLQFIGFLYRKSKDMTDIPICAVNILSQHFLLTAGHCFIDSKNKYFTVYFV